jgi:glycosyltransferase involved in cell wall biosynthesis
VRIALVVTGGLHPGGREQVIPALLWFLERLAREHDVHAFALRHLPVRSTYQLHGATVHDLGRPEGRVRQTIALQRALRAAGPFDVIHGYFADPAGWVAAVAGRTMGIPTLVTCDSGEFTSLPQIDYGLQRTWRGRVSVKTACRFASGVHVMSTFMETLAQQQRLSPTRIVFGVDLGRFSFRETPDGPPWRLLQVASLNAVKDQSTALQALAIVRQRLNVELDLVGEDTLGGALQQRAASLGIANAVRFHGFLPQDALPALHRAAHLYVQTSLHEAAGVSVLEAAAAGLPVVGTRVGFVSDWAGKAAVAVPPGDPRALAHAIVDLLHDAGRRRDLAHAARAWVEQHDADHTARAMVRLYESLASSSRVRPDGQR